VFLNNRYYNPTVGVFLSVDPMVAKTGDPYLYAAGNPTTFSDPSGLCAVTQGMHSYDDGKGPCGGGGSHGSAQGLGGSATPVISASLGQDARSVVELYGRDAHALLALADFNLLAGYDYWGNVAPGAQDRLLKMAVWQAVGERVASVKRDPSHDGLNSDDFRKLTMLGAAGAAAIGGFAAGSASGGLDASVSTVRSSISKLGLDDLFDGVAIHTDEAPPGYYGSTSFTEGGGLQTNFFSEAFTSQRALDLTVLHEAFHVSDAIVMGQAAYEEMGACGCQVYENVANSLYEEYLGSPIVDVENR
jgi:hypothetical protein